MDIGKAFTFVLDDEDKIIKLLIGAIVAIIPIVNLAGLGYMVQLVRNVRDDQETPLPTWEDFGNYFMDGLKVFVGMLVYSLPLILLICVFGVVLIGVNNIPDRQAAEGIMIVMIICLSCFTLFFSLIPFIALPALVAYFAETAEMAAMWRVGEIWSFIQADIGSYAILLLVALIAIFLIAPLGGIACGIGIFITNWYAYLIFGHLTGQLARNNDMLVI